MEQANVIFSNPVVLTVIGAVKIVFIIVSLILFIAVIVLLVKTTWLRFRFYENYTEFFASRPFGKKAKFQKFESINKKLNSGKDQDYKIAVMEAEEFLQEVLQKMGYEGEKLDDVLKTVDSKVLPSIDKVKEAQRVRADIVYNPSYRLSKEQAVNIVKVYEQALNELEAL